MEIAYRKLERPDLDLLRQLVRLYEDVFEMQSFTMPPDSHLQSLLGKEMVIYFVALSGDEVVGGLTAHVLPSTYSEAGQVYVYDLAVRQVMQRRGVGRGLMSALQVHAAALGASEIFVQADRSDQHAIDFYRAIGGTPEDVLHFTYALGSQSNH